jgi:RimJ/RimL family protein N-acetyltransferase
VSRALLRKAFDGHHAKCVFAQADAENTASRRVMEKAELIFEREFVDQDDPGRRVTAIYRLLRSQSQTIPDLFKVP